MARMSEWGFVWKAPLLCLMLMALQDQDTVGVEGSVQEIVASSSSYKEPDTSGLSFVSTFQGENGLESWVMSANSKYEGQDVSLADCSLEGLEEDKGLLLGAKHKHYGLTSPFATPLSIDGKDLVIQYEVELRNGLTCGGAYIKVVRDEPGLDLTNLDNETPYTIMFGPDKCGTTNKVHFIFQHKNPVTGGWEEKHLENPPKIKNDKKNHVYTLHIKSDNAFEIYIDTESVSTGSLLESFQPPVNPPAEIDDPEDFMPEDWVDEAKIADPEASKPEDWDEDAPARILDEDAIMPEGWLVEEPLRIPDPEGVKPEDWDDEEDGEWEPVLVANPKCDEAPGCGVWQRPTKANPDYKGKWVAPLIDNPAYKGEWEPRKIANPNFFEDKNPANLAPMAGVSVEIWTIDGGIWMDNFVVSNDITSALAFAGETWKPKADLHKAADEKAKKAKRAEKMKDSPMNKVTISTLEYIREHLPEQLLPAFEYIEANPVSVFVTLLAGIAIMLVRINGRKRMRAAVAPVAATTGTEGNVDAGGAEGEDEDEDKEEDEDHDDDNATPAPEVKRRTGATGEPDKGD